MLNAFNTRIFFIVLLVVAVLLKLFYPIPLWIYPVLLFIYFCIVFLGSYFIRSNFFVKTLWKGDASRKAIAITFDDGPVIEFTPRLLDLLKAEQVPAAFFLIGKNMEGNELLAKRIMDEGHVIGNHSYTHDRWFSLKSGEKILSDLQKCDEKIRQVIGKKPRFFRPPYGVTNPKVASAVTKGNYDCIGWSIRTYDTNVKSAEQLLQRSLKNLDNGDIILFHDWGKYTIGILSDFIKEVRARGFEIVRVDELLKMKAYY